MSAVSLILPAAIRRRRAAWAVVATPDNCWNCSPHPPDSMRLQGFGGSTPTGHRPRGKVHEAWRPLGTHPDHRGHQHPTVGALIIGEPKVVRWPARMSPHLACSQRHGIWSQRTRQWRVLKPCHVGPPVHVPIVLAVAASFAPPVCPCCLVAFGATHKPGAEAGAQRLAPVKELKVGEVDAPPRLKPRPCERAQPSTEIRGPRITGRRMPRGILPQGGCICQAPHSFKNTCKK